MYSQLDVIDIVVEDDPNQPLFFQTDHRATDEIEEACEVSTLFALTRVLMPLQKDPRAKVVYVPAHPLPEFFEDVLSAGGGYVQYSLDGEPVRAKRSSELGINDFADNAFMALAAKVRLREGLAPGVPGLQTYEEAVAEQGLVEGEKETSIEYWTAIVELAALAGELLREQTGGRWVFDEVNMTSVPFLFSAGQQLINPTGKAQKFIGLGPGEAPSRLLESVASFQADEHLFEDGGEIMCSLKPWDWGGCDTTMGEPLCPSDENSDVTPPPYVAYGKDFPNTFQFFSRDGEEEPADVRAMASLALENISPDINTVEFPDGHEMLLIEGSYFAAEKILDRAFMCALAEGIGAQDLIVAIPKKGMMLLADAASTPEQLDRLRAIAASTFEEEGSPDALYPLPFLVSEGQVVAILVDDTQPPVKKKGFLRRLFS